MTLRRDGSSFEICAVFRSHPLPALLLRINSPTARAISRSRSRRSSSNNGRRLRQIHSIIRLASLIVIPIVIIPRQSAADLLLQGILRPIILTSLTDIPIATVLVVILVPTFLVPTAPGLRQRDIVGMPPQNPPRLLRPRLTKKTCTRHIVRTWAQKCPVIQAIDSVMGIQVIVFTRMPLLLRLLLVRIHLLNRHGAMTPLLLLTRHGMMPHVRLTIGPPGTPFTLQMKAILLPLLLVKAILLPRDTASRQGRRIRKTPSARHIVRTYIVRTWAQKCPVIQAIDSVMGIQVIVFTRMPLLLRLLLVRIHLLNRHGAMTQVRLTHNESKSKSKCTNRNPTCTIFQPMPILLRLLLTHTFLLLPRHRLIPQEKLTMGPPGTPFTLQVNAILLHLLLVKAILLPRHAAPKPHGKNFLDAGAKVGPLFYN